MQTMVNVSNNTQAEKLFLKKITGGENSEYNWVAMARVKGEGGSPVKPLVGGEEGVPISLEYAFHLPFLPLPLQTELQTWLGYPSPVLPGKDLLTKNRERTWDKGTPPVRG